MKITHTLYIIFAILVIALVGASTSALGQDQVDGPTALIISYHARPGTRTTFRSVMQSEGIAQLEKWEKDGVFTKFNALFTTYAADRDPDMFLILHFNHFTDLAKWQKIEETYPGGLTAKAQTLANADTTGTADIVDEGSDAPTTNDSQFVILEYEVTVDMPKYVSYVHGYVAPQFQEWMKAGVLRSFECFTNQNPAGAPWSSFIVLEYKDLKSLAAREVTKKKAREELAISNPTWKKWSDDKSAIRKEKAVISARSLN